MKKQGLKVIHIASGDLWAGAEVQLYTLATTLHKKLDIATSVVILNHGKLEQKLRGAGIDIVVLDESKFNPLQIFFHLVRILLVQKPNVVHTHRIKENILGSIAAFFAGNIPSIRTAHGAQEHPPSWRQPNKHIIYALDWFCGQFLQRKIIAVSEDLAKILKNDFPSKKIHIVENGIDLDSIQFQESLSFHTTNSKLKPFKVGLVGRLVPVKRVDLFIKTARYIHDHYPEQNTSFYIYGDGPLRNNLEQLCYKLNVNAIVHFEGYHKDIHRRIRELDVLLMTSDHEGLPMTLLEAMALKTPIIGHAVGGIPKLLDYGACGVLSNDHSPADYASKIQRLIYDPYYRLDITKKAYQRVKTQYSALKNAEELSCIYAEISNRV
jgi:glycosyltransferase involved in cell wall biosynthesis